MDEINAIPEQPEFEEEEDSGEFHSASASPDISRDFEEFKNERFRENIQAFSYDRNFLLKGPIVQVFQPGQE